MCDHQTVNIRAVARDLSKVLGPTLVATLAGSEVGLISEEWARADGPLPDAAAEERLRTAWAAWNALVQGDCPSTIRGWFIGDNPVLGEPPVMALRQGRLDEVRAAARSFAEGAWQL
jgi:hypothetical protein